MVSEPMVVVKWVWGMVLVSDLHENVNDFRHKMDESNSDVGWVHCHSGSDSTRCVCKSGSLGVFVMIHIDV